MFSGLAGNVQVHRSSYDASHLFQSCYHVVSYMTMGKSPPL